MRHVRPLLTCSLSSAAILLAWQAGLSRLGIAENELTTTVLKTYFQNTRPGDIPGLYLFKPAVRQQLKAGSAAERVRLVREIGPIVKRVVSTPAFAKLHTEWIRQQFHAVDHGVKVGEPGVPTGEPQMNELMSQAVVQMVDSFKSIPPDGLKMIFESDLKSWSRARDPKKQRLYARAQQIQPLLASNPDEFRKQYGLLKSQELGGPETEAALDAARATGKKNAEAEQREKEQRAYNEHNLRNQLRLRLAEFVKTARGVDYAAQTTSRNNRQVFVNPEYERKSDAWKKLYRIGREPAMAAAAFAEQWLKEL